MTQYSFKNLQNRPLFSHGEGRLGNQLWRIAWTYGQAVSNNGEMTCIPDWKYKKIFCLPEEFYINASEDSIDGGVEYYQDLKHWDFCSKDIWGFFQPSDFAKKRLESYVKGYSQNMIQYGCAIHHRFGDYLMYPGIFPILPPEYYINSMVYILNKEPNSTFYIFSDDINKTKELYTSQSTMLKLLQNNKIIFLQESLQASNALKETTPPNDWLDLFSISMCKHHIIANSTFSWWGAFLSENKEVIYPSIWFGTDPSVKEIPWKNMIPDGWKEINVN